MKLYMSPGACSLSPHIALREAGLPFEIERVNLGTKKTASGADYKAVNPKGYVPALQLDDGSILTEGPAIVQYIADQSPSAKLAPANGTLERYRLQEWLNFIGTEVHKTFGQLFNSKAPEETKAAVRTVIDRRLEFLDQTFAVKPYLMGESFTVADGYLFTVLTWAGILKIDVKPYENVVAFVERVGARPAVKAALAAEFS